MLLRLAELCLTIIYQLLILLTRNKNKDKSPIQTNKSPEGTINLQDVIRELKKIESDRKKMSYSEQASRDDVKGEVQELNERLKVIETILFEKRSELLKDKIMGNNSKSKDK